MTASIPTAAAHDRPLAAPQQVAQWSLDVLMSGKSLYLQQQDRSYQFRYSQQQGEIAVDAYKDYGSYKGTDYLPLGDWSSAVAQFGLDDAYNKGAISLKPIDPKQVLKDLDQQILEVIAAGNVVVQTAGLTTTKVSLVADTEQSAFRVALLGADEHISPDVQDYPITDDISATWQLVSEENGIARAAHAGALEVERQDGSRVPFEFFDINQVQSAPSLQAQAEPPSQVSSGVAHVDNAEVNAPAPVQPSTQSQGTLTMSTEVAEATAQEPKKLDGRTKAGKAAKAAAKAAQEQEVAGPAPEPITTESITTEEISSALDAVMGVEPEQAQQSEPEKPSYDIGMSMFGNGNGANLFAKLEQAAIMQQVATDLGVEMKMSNPKAREDGTPPEPKPYISVKNDQVQAAVDKLQAAGLSVNDTRERFQEGRENYLAEKKAAKEQAAETLRVEGAGNLLILAAKATLEHGKTFVEGERINLYQTKESVAEQKQIAADCAAGKSVEDKPIEYGAYNKDTKMQIAKGTVGRSEDGQVQINVTVDKIAEANAKLPADKQIKPPTRAQAIESLQKMVETKAQIKVGPVKKDKAKSDDGR